MGSTVDDSIPHLPGDIITHILSYLTVQDVLNARLVSQSFNSLTHLRTLWLSLLQTHILSHSLPIPHLQGRPLSSLSSFELESAVRRSLQLSQTWSSPTPTPKKTEKLQGITMQSPTAQIIAMYFLGWNLFMSVAVAAPRSGSHLRPIEFRCWDVGYQTTKLLGTLAMNATGWGVNTHPDYSGTIAVVVDSEIQILKPDMDTCTFTKTLTIPLNISTLRIYAFRGTIIVTESQLGVFSVRDIRDNLLREFILQNPDTSIPQGQPCHDVLITDTYLILAKAQCLELYSLENLYTCSSKAPSANRHLTTLHPISYHQWQFPIDSLCLSLIINGSTKELNILLRYSTYYPWPINVLHHYSIPSNPHHDPARPLHSSLNSPFTVPMVPTLKTTLASPIRLLSPYSMALGTYGTALWTDSHTEDYYSHSDSGQRLAARQIVHDRHSEDELAGGGQGQIDPMQVTHKAATVFDVSELDEWVKVAVDDDDGRVAIACKGGGVLLKRYC